MSAKAAVSGLFWNSAESFFLQLIQLLVSMVLARLLTAADFGLIALVSVFITVSDAIAQGGFRSTIIMRPHLTDVDYSTAFIYNLVVAAGLYLVLFFSAPFIAGFYDEPQLVILVRVLALVILVHAGYFVQDALLQRHMRFKLLAQRNIMASALSGAIAIGMAFKGFGVWSLVSLTISRAVIINIYLWIKSVWKLSFRFSAASFRQNFSFGSRMMLTGLTGVLFSNLNNLLIGKYYSKSDLGYYYQARKLQNVPIQSACGVLTKTATPLLSKYQESLADLHKTYFQITRIAALVVIPVTVLLFVLSRDLIVVLFSDKWLASVPIFRILILTGLFAPFVIINGQSPAIMGDSRFYLRYDTVWKILFLAVTFFALQFSLLVFIACQAGLIVLQMILNSIIVRKYFKVGLKAQARVYAPYFAYSTLAGLPAYLITLLPGLLPIFRLILSAAVFLVIFVSLVYTLERKTFNDALRLLGTWLDKARRRGMTK